MKCINKKKKTAAVSVLVSVILLCMTGCSKESLIAEYPVAESNENIFSTSSASTLPTFSEELCVTTDNVIPQGFEEFQTEAAGLFSLDEKQVLYANNIFQKMYPASITKIMTALVFFENYSGDYSEILTAGSSVKIDESGAQTCGFSEGDQIPLELVLNGLLVYSGNDAAQMIADYIAGSEENFVAMMNQTAKRLGATGTNFVNTHGLSDENHYTTAYDIYLIFNEVMKYDKFIELVSKKDYSGEYIKSSGDTKKVNWKSTNLYFTGEKDMPDNITVIGGKTGTTRAAGSCLVVLSQNSSGKRFISIVMKAEDKASLYTQMSQLLNLAAAS